MQRFPNFSEIEKAAVQLCMAAFCCTCNKMGFVLFTEINFQKYVDLNCAKL